MCEYGSGEPDFKMAQQKLWGGPTFNASGEFYLGKEKGIGIEGKLPCFEPNNHPMSRPGDMIAGTVRKPSVEPRMDV